MSTKTPYEYHPKPGYVGNLSAIQEFKLKEAHLALLQACGSASKDLKVGIQVKDKPQETGGKSMFSFRSSNNDVNTSVVDPERCLSDFVEACGDIPQNKILDAFKTAALCDHPDSLMLRFLRARKWDTAKALIQLGHTLHWRSCEKHLETLLTRGDEYYTKVKPDPGYLLQYKSGIVCMHGHDKHDRPIVFVNVGKHDPKAQSHESMELYTIYLIESCRLVLSSNISTAAIVFNMTDFGLSNMDYHMVKFLLSCFEQYYPECLGYLFIHRAPWVFSSIWSIIKGWIDPVVASKISFTKKDSDLLKYIDSDQLPKYLGGTSKFDYHYIPPKENEDSYLEKTEERDRLIKQRQDLYAKFEDITLKWVLTKDQEESDKLKQSRNDVAAEICEQYWHLDPYIRARTQFDRDGTLGEFKEELLPGHVAQPTL